MDISQAGQHKVPISRRIGIAMKDWLLQIFTWWNGQTIGTRFYTWRFGRNVGSDQFGNV